MRISVKFHGSVGRGSQPLPRHACVLTLPGGATVGDLLHALADRFGAPFSEIVASDDARLPRNIRIFADGDLLASSEQPVVPSGSESASVTVVFMSPISGG
ncbi:MAG: MoaD/ThiS family protein [Deltaproteobacteria bacterium]|nr:MoaD/ThiS family protein [Deltaproteobacteria bacterium]